MSIPLKDADKPVWYELDAEVILHGKVRVQVVPSEAIKLVGEEVTIQTLKALDDAVIISQAEVHQNKTWQQARMFLQEFDLVEVDYLGFTDANPAKAKRAAPAKKTTAKKPVVKKTTGQAKAGRARAGAAKDPATGKTTTTKKPAAAKTTEETKTPTKVGRRNASSK